MKKTRYPGAQPFDTDQEGIFFGRDKDIAQLYKRIRLEPLVVLSGKSGSGKSSLINAGIVPRALEDGRYDPIRVRFNAWAEGHDNVSPLQTTQRSIRKGLQSADTFLDKIIPNEDTLWHDVREHQILHMSSPLGLLLLFDQFEELFTYPEDQILAFRRQLAEAMFTAVPQRYWDVLEQHAAQGAPTLTGPEMGALQTPPSIRIALTIRSDRLHLLQRINDFIPINLKDCFDLGPLDESAATEAIREPAALAAGTIGFDTPTFHYHPAALDKILDFLTDNGTDRIETTQLQIVCHSIEQRVTDRYVQPGAARHDDSPEAPSQPSSPIMVFAEDIGNLGAIINEYYDDKISLIQDHEQQQAARLLIEDGLILEEEERRLSLYEGQATRTYGVTLETLRLLVDSHLLRAEPSMQGGYTYELSHDTLVRPVLEAKEERTAQENLRKAEQERQAQETLLHTEQENLRRERKRSQRARRAALTMAVLAAASVISFVAAVSLFFDARRSKEEAIAARDRATSSLKNLQIAERERLKQDAHIYMNANLFVMALRTLSQVDTAVVDNEVNDMRTQCDRDMLLQH